MANESNAGLFSNEQFDEQVQQWSMLSSLTVENPGNSTDPKQASLMLTLNMSSCEGQVIQEKEQLIDGQYSSIAENSSINVAPDNIELSSRTNKAKSIILQSSTVNESLLNTVQAYQSCSNISTSIDVSGQTPVHIRIDDHHDQNESALPSISPLNEILEDDCLQNSNTPSNYNEDSVPDEIDLPASTENPPTASSSSRSNETLNETTKRRRRKKGKPVFNKTKKPQRSLDNYHRYYALKRAEAEADSVGYNRKYRMIDFMQIGDKVCYKVEEKGDGLKTLTSQTVRKKCPINAIYLLESRVQFQNSLSFESIVKYGEYLKKYY